MTVFLAGILSKKYTNPSSDIITVLAGLDQVDAVFLDFANAIEATIRAGRSLEQRKKAIQAALSLTAGAYQTSLVSYFTHKDLFPALMKYVQDSDSINRTYEPFLLLGLLANYNKFEFRNPYRLRLEDFVNETTVEKIVAGFADSCLQIRGRYIEILDDVPESNWTLASALAYIGLGVLAPVRAINPVGTDIEALEQEKFAVLPGPEIAVFLAVYDFANANKIFNYNLLAVPESKKNEPPFSAYLSLISYVLHHAFRNTRASHYGILALSTLRIIIEDHSLCKRLCDPSTTSNIRLCRQRQPYLPSTFSSRPLAAQIIDVALDAVNHNLRRRLDIELYTAALHLIQRLMICMAQNHIRFPYHWPLLWQSLLSLIRFLQSYAADLTSAHSAESLQMLFTPLFNSLALAVARGTQFLPDTASYDDLSYKLVEQHKTLTDFKAAFPSLATPATGASSPIDLLIATAAHFHGVLEAEREKGRVRSTLSTKEVNRVIRAGYESLDVPEIGSMGVESFQVWRETEERGFMKKVARIAVEDVRKMLLEGR